MQQANKFLQIPIGQMSGLLAKTKVQFHHEQLQLLIVHDRQLAIYDAAKLECLKQVSCSSTCTDHALPFACNFASHLQQFLCSMYAEELHSRI